MATSTVNLSSADVEQASAAPSQQTPSLSSSDVELSSSDVEQQGASHGPVNPYANPAVLGKRLDQVGMPTGWDDPDVYRPSVQTPPLIPVKPRPLTAGEVEENRLNPQVRIAHPVAHAPRTYAEEAAQTLGPISLQPSTTRLSQPATPQQLAGNVDVQPENLATAALLSGKDIQAAGHMASIPERQLLEAQQEQRPTGFAAGPRMAANQINRGTSDIAQGLDPNPHTEMTPQEAVQAGVPLPNYNAPTGPNQRQMMRGATQTLQGAMTLGTPEFAMAAWQAPVKTAAFYFAGIKAGQGAEYVAKQAGMSPEAQELANTVGFFIPVAFHTVTQLRGEISTRTARVPDPQTGEVNEVPVKTAAVGGRGFGFGVGKGEDGSYYAAGRVGPFSAKARWGGASEAPGESSPGGPRTIAGQLPAKGVDPTANLGTPTAPDPVSIQRQAQEATITETAARAAEIQTKAEQVAGLAPPPPPPPPPGAPGSHEIPAPQGMDDGHLSPQTVSMAGRAIQMLPEQVRPRAILEAVGNLAKWMFGKKTIIGPDGKVVNVDSQKAAQNEAVKIINGEVDRQEEEARGQAEARQSAIEERDKSAETAEQERQESLNPVKPAKESTENSQSVEIPNTPQVQRARAVLQAAPDHMTSEQLDALVRSKAMVTTSVRKSLVEEEISRRANQQEDMFEEGMNGAPIETGRSREELQRWADAVKSGERPFMHVPAKSDFVPRGLDEFQRTPVKGAGAFSGNYYHAPEISAADIRKAARDKHNPQAALDALEAQWRSGGAAGESQSGETKTEAPAANVQRADGEVQGLKGIEGKKVMLNLADGSRIPARHRLVSFSDLTASHSGITFLPKPGYPEGVQERSYHTSKPEQMKVMERDNDLKPELLSNTDTTGQTGPPVVTSRDVTIDGKLIPRGTVLGGNSRAMTVERMYTNGDSSVYNSHVVEHAAAYGFNAAPVTPEENAAIQQPVHVLEVEPPTSIEELHRLGSLLNKPQAQSLDLFDRAVSLAKAISADTLNGVADLIRQESDADSTATLNAVLTNPRTGRQVVRMLAEDGIITERNVGDFVDPSTGLLIPAARTQLGNAMLATLLNSRELMEKTPPLVKQKLLGSIGAISTLLTRDDGYNIAPAMRAAALDYGRLFRGEHMSVTDAVNQAAMFEQRGPVLEALVKKFDQNIAEVRKAFSTFAVGAAMASANGGNLLPIAQTPEPYLDFNFAFGTELTSEQFDAEMKALAEDGTKPAQEETPSSTPAVTPPVSAPPAGRVEPKPQATVPVAPQAKPLPESALPAIKEGDPVEYTTNKGKTRNGKVVRLDGESAYIRDGDSTVKKPLADIRVTGAGSGTAIVPAEPRITTAGELQAPVKALEQQTEEDDNSLAATLHSMITAGNAPGDYNTLKRVVESFDGKPADQMRMKQAQEAFEAALAKFGQDLSTLADLIGAKPAYDQLVKMYEGQPNLSIRSSTSIENQAYSTPLPLAFIAGRFADLQRAKTAYEPTGGNGMLLIGRGNHPGARANTLANELDQIRAENLSWLGFKVERNNASTWSPAERFDAVVANPPFGNLQGPVDFENYKITKLEHLIMAKALSVMKDSGRASLIMAAGDREEAGKVTDKARPFYNWLYSHYNVVADFELEGDLYSRQGASYPVRFIAVDGRVRSAKVSPLPEDIKRLATWGEVYDKAAEHLGADLQGRRRADNELGDSQRPESSQPGAVPGISSGSDSIAHSGGSGASAAGHGSNERPTNKPGPIQHTGTVPDPGVGSADITVRSDGDVAQSDRLAEGQPATRAVRREPAKSDGHSPDALADESNQFQITYHPSSSKHDVAVMAPKALVEPMRDAMDRIAEQVGDIDQWVADELAYAKIDDLHDAFMGLQVDAIAGAIFNIQRGKSIIVADQTGVGKGRVAAAIIRWSEMHGYLPIFMTAGDQLFTAMQNDLHDIGSGDVINPLLFNADASITDPRTGAKIFRNTGAMRPVFERILETGEIPKGRNAVYLTYSQVNIENRQQLALRRLAPRAVFVLDESHNAGGDSNTGQFMQEVLANAQGAMFLSATWAKRPDNVPLYAGKTDISMAIPDKDRVSSAIAAGGAPLQAVLTSQLAQSAQFVRRERSFDGIKLENFVDEAHQAEHTKIADQITEVLRSIVAADKAYHELDFASIAAMMKKAGKSAGSKPVVVNHMEFSSIVHNLVKQMLLAVKADISAEKIIEAIKDGKKPIYALENTMGSFIDGYVAAKGLREGDTLEGLTYSRISDRALARTRYYNETNEMGDKRRVEVPLEMLSEPVREAYDRAQALIDALDLDLPVSPIDYIRQKVEAAGYKIAEITGRTLRIDYSGKVPKLATVPGIEKKDRVNTATLFNNGGIDALILNQAGATGISLHASEKFRDQRPRLMIVGQPAGDVNIVMQMLGRVNRTGQVVLPEYLILAAALPAEERPAINLAKKMKSLNANTSSNTRSATSIKAVDLMNKYGDQVVAQYLVDNPDMMRHLGLDVSQNQDGGFSEIENLAMKATGRSALLPVKDQRSFMDSITEAHTSYIEYLDETGQNDLEPKDYDFDARETLSKRIYQGTNSSSPFGQDAHYGEYSIKRQGKPFTPEEVEGKLAETFGPEAMKLMPNVRDTLAARALAAHMEELYKPYYDGLSSDHARERAGLIREMGRSILNEYRVGVGLRVDINGDHYNAIVTRIDGAKRPSGNPYAPSALKFYLAVNGPLRSVPVPGSQIKGITVTNLGRNADVKELFQDFFGDSRQKAKIITGNLLGAYGEMKAGVKGRIISFTMADGSNKLGILMPAKFDVEKDVSGTYAMRSAEGAKAFLESGDAYLQSQDGEVGIWGPSHNKPGFEIRTKVSKAASGRFFLDSNLRALVAGNDFVSKGGLMRATVRSGQETAAIKTIMDKIALYASPSSISQAREADEKAQSELDQPPPPKGGKPRQDPSATTSFLGAGYAAKGAGELFDYVKQAAPATIEDLVKAAKLTGRTMKQVGREIVSTLYPRALADEDAKDIMGRGIGMPALTLFRASHLMEGIAEMFRGMPEDQQVEFVDRWQRGNEQPTPELQSAQEIMQGILDGQRQEERYAINLGRSKKHQVELSDRPNYFPNRYKVRPGQHVELTEQEQIERIAGGVSRRPFEGSKAFLKQQKFTLKEAVAEGAVPLGTPVQMLMRRLQEGAKFVAAKYVMHSYKEAGIITFLKTGKKMPAGYTRIEDKMVKVWRPIETEDGGIFFKQTGEWVGQKDAVRLLNNYLSVDHIRGTAAGKALISLKNASTEIRLSFSPFHWAYITVENWASALNLGIDKLFNQGLRQKSGNAALEGLADIGKAAIAPYTAIKMGGQMLTYAKNPDQFLETPEGRKFVELIPEYPDLMESLFAGGLRWGMPETYRLSLGDNFTEEIMSGHLGAATLKFFPWLSHMMMKPLFEHYIPRSKWAFAVQMLAAKLNQYSEAIAAGEITKEQIARDVASATENRFGEFNFDNLYWNNTFRTANQIAFRSVSWKAGTWLGAGKAVKETFTSQAFNDGTWDRIEEDGKPSGWQGKLPQLGINAGWIMSMGLICSVISSVMVWLATKTPIWEHAEEDHRKKGISYLGALALEAMHPRTGYTDEHGEPVRLSFPTGLKDYEHAILHPGSYFKGSMADWAGASWDTLQNEDAFGNYVYNPNAPIWTKFVQGAEYNLKGDFLPISVSNYNRSYGPQDRAGRAAQATGLVGGAPKELERSKALNRALEERKPHTPMTPEEQEERNAAKSAPPTRQQVLRAAREKNLDYLQKVILYDLTYQQARDIYDNYATAAERAALQPIMRRKQESMIRQHRSIAP